MTPFENLKQRWAEIEQRFMNSAPMRRLEGADVGLLHYAAYLRETYFYTREDPQIQAAATAYFRGKDRELVKTFLQHAGSEVGHDQLALDDLATLGFDADGVPDENPLPSTASLIAWPYFAMQHRSACSYLGYLFFLEFLPTAQGDGIAGKLKALGIPTAAMTFLLEHNSVDLHHNKLMQKYADAMLRTQANIDEVVYSIEVTAQSFAAMLIGAFAAADEGRLPLRRALAGVALKAAS